ncbi:MAG: 50S ribosomal protein L35ae [Nanoarchaeota archaeon]|nr:50S ribosomal protein L35ae [Nanoarchaeota archaeon]
MKILSYRRGRKTIYNNQAVISLDGVRTADEAKKYIGKKVRIDFSSTYIIGVITKVHGKKGRVIARFRRGLPGQSILKEIKLIG